MAAIKTSHTLSAADPCHAFAEQGYLIVPDVLTATQCTLLRAHVDALNRHDAGTRRLLDHTWCRDLASAIRTYPSLSTLVPAVAVQCTYFEKTATQNWLVALHQDLSIPVRERVADPSCTGWSEKEGILFVQPPPEVLEQLTAVRVHLDDSTLASGPLRVVPGSHRHGRLSAAQAQDLRQQSGEQQCPAPAGSALLMRPLLLHASSKSRTSAPRRVLHFVFGPAALPAGLQWRDAH